MGNKPYVLSVSRIVSWVEQRAVGRATVLSSLLRLEEELEKTVEVWVVQMPTSQHVVDIKHNEAVKCPGLYWVFLA